MKAAILLSGEEVVQSVASKGAGLCELGLHQVYRESVCVRRLITQDF